MRSLLLVLAVGCSDYAFIPKEPDGDGPIDTGYSDTDTGEGDPDDDTGLASIRGRVCDLAGEGHVVGARVWVDIDDTGDGTPDRTIESVTDADGYFVLEGVPMGNHTVRVQKGSFSTSFEVLVSAPGTLELAEEECLQQEDVRIAVVTGEYDHIQSFLDRMGLEYTAYNGVTGNQYIDFLTDRDEMAEYDIIFFNCGVADTWLTRKNEIGTNIRDYVASGGSIYASDWAYYFFEAAFPDDVDFYEDDLVYGNAFVGLDGGVVADVLDPNMIAILGSNQADLRYDLAAWVVPVSARSTVSTMVRGTARLYYGGQVTGAPLAVRLERGGTAIYTTFHNEQQITLHMEELLEEIILSL